MRTPVAADLSPRRFQALLTAYREELRTHRYSLAAQDHLRSGLARLFSFLRGSGVRDVRRVSLAHLTAFARALKTAKSSRDPGVTLSVATQAIYLGVVRRFFVFLERRGVIVSSPATELVGPKVERLPRAVPSQSQARRLMDTPLATTALGKRDRAILETLYGTGIRVGECMRIDLGDLDLSGRSLWIRNGKGRKDRLVPLGGRVAAALDVYLQEVRPDLVHDPAEASLFLGPGGKRLSKPALTRLVKSYGRAAGFKVFPHALRHACATHMLEGGADIREVQKLLGHQHLDTTALYTQVAIRDLRAALRRSHPRDRQKPRRPRIQ